MIRVFALLFSVFFGAAAPVSAEGPLDRRGQPMDCADVLLDQQQVDPYPLAKWRQAHGCVIDDLLAMAHHLFPDGDRCATLSQIAEGFDVLSVPSSLAQRFYPSPSLTPNALGVAHVGHCQALVLMSETWFYRLSLIELGQWVGRAGPEALIVFEDRALGAGTYDVIEPRIIAHTDGHWRAYDYRDIISLREH